METMQRAAEAAEALPPMETVQRLAEAAEALPPVETVRGGGVDVGGCVAGDV